MRGEAGAGTAEKRISSSLESVQAKVLNLVAAEDA
jgi:hypothetical protein